MGIYPHSQLKASGLDARPSSRPIGDSEVGLPILAAGKKKKKRQKLFISLTRFDKAIEMAISKVNPSFK